MWSGLQPAQCRPVSGERGEVRREPARVRAQQLARLPAPPSELTPDRRAGQSRTVRAMVEQHGVADAERRSPVQIRRDSSGGWQHREHRPERCRAGAGHLERVEQH